MLAIDPKRKSKYGYTSEQLARLIELNLLRIKQQVERAGPSLWTRNKISQTIPEQWGLHTNQVGEIATAAAKWLVDKGILEEWDHCNGNVIYSINLEVA